MTNENSGRIDLASGLIAEASPFAAENYIVFAKTRQPQHTSSTAQETTTTTRQHPRFFLEDYSWYRALEARIDHNLDRWEANARKRSEQRRATAKQSLQRLFDSIQAPVSAAFGSVTARLGPVADRLHSMIQSEFGNRRLSLVASKVEPSPVDDDLSQQEQQPHRIEQTTSSKSVLQQKKWNKEDPEDLIVLTKTGETLLLLEDVNPVDRLLALPVIEELSSTGRSRSRPPFHLKLARGGLVITLCLITAGAIAPAYRSLRFILEYPRTAEVVMIALVGSVAYNLWAWRTNAKTRQRELIAEAVRSRLLAKDEAAISYLMDGAVDCLTHAVMDDYVSRLLDGDDDKNDRPSCNPFVTEIGLCMGLLKREYPDQDEEPIGAKRRTSLKMMDTSTVVAVEWEKARSELVHKLASRM